MQATTSGDESDSYGFVNYLIGLGLADRTIRIYGNAVERWLIHCGRSGLDPLAPERVQVRAYSEELPDTRESRRQHAVALGHYLRYRGGDDSVTGAIRIPRQEEMFWNGIEGDQAAAVVQVSRGVFPEGTATLFMLLMGLRRAEAAAAEWPRFDKELTRYRVHGKGNKVAEIPVHPIIADEVRGRETPYRWLFPGRNTGHVSPASMGVWVAQIGTAAGVEGLTPHKLRHTFISDVNDTSGDLRVAQKLARHKSPETTAGYTRVSWDKMAKASASLSYAPVRAVVNE
jgi:integrase